MVDIVICLELKKPTYPLFEVHTSNGVGWLFAYRFTKNTIAIS